MRTLRWRPSCSGVRRFSETDGHKKGRRHLDCPHGRSRKGSTGEARPVQNVKFTKCPVRVVLVENDDGSWTVAKTILDLLAILSPRKITTCMSTQRDLMKETRNI